MTWTLLTVFYQEFGQCTIQAIRGPPTFPGHRLHRAFGQFDFLFSSSHLLPLPVLHRVQRVRSGVTPLLQLLHLGIVLHRVQRVPSGVMPLVQLLHPGIVLHRVQRVPSGVMPLVQLLHPGIVLVDPTI